VPVRLILNLLLGAALLSATSAAPAAAPPAPVLNPSDLLAHGSEDQFWIARVEPVPGAVPASLQTSIYVRSGGQAAWQSASSVQARVIDIANRGSQLALLLESGDWVAASEDSSTIGAPLPDNARMIAIAGESDTLWALGRVAESNTPASGPSSAPAKNPAETLPIAVPATTQAAAALAGSGATRVVLYCIIDGQWKAKARLPTELNSLAPMRLCVAQKMPFIAVLESAHRVRVMRLKSDEWIDAADLSTQEGVAALKLLSGTSSAVLWLAQSNGQEALHFLYDLRPPRLVTLPPAAGPLKEQAVAFAAGRIHILSPANGKDTATLLDQKYDANTGLASGPASTLPLSVGSPYPDITRPTQVIVWVALVFAIASSMRWRKAMQNQVFDLDALHLAPIGLRLAAGLIDFVPALTPLLILLRPDMASEAHLIEVLEFGSAPLYLLHTTLIETIFGRSLGKMCLGLRVISIDGTRPSTGALLIRNLLRVIDVGLALLPLGVILFSPLRQRTGDVAAGTLVVFRPAGTEPIETTDAAETGVAKVQEPATRE